MIRRRTLGLIGVVVAFLILAWPLAAAERTYRFDIPGCYS
jgi:hypothetical protein